MRIATLLIAISLLLSSVAAICQDSPPTAPDPPADAFDSTPPPPPAPSASPDTSVTSKTPQPAPEGVSAEVKTPWLMQKNNPYVIVGPSDSKGKPRMIKGKVTIIARPAPGVKVASVAILIDERPASSASSDNMGLYGLEFDASTLTEGEHSIKAIGADTEGKQAWTATTHVDVRNKQSEAPSTSTPTPTQTAVVPDPSNKTTPVVKVAPVTPSAKPASSTKKPTPKSAPQTVHGTLGKTYTSAKYGFWISPPAGWTAKDKTAAIRPVKDGNGWIEFSPTKSEGIAVNVRRMSLEPGTTADVFAKFNPYVAKWDRKTVHGMDAFSTNTDTGNKIIHRLIIIKNGVAWMLNCVDANGKVSDAGQKLFDSMVASFGVALKPAPKPTATP